MRRGYRPPTHSATEFELDLAPLLAVMVKLVPVLLISSAFVQLMIVETDLPQVVKEALDRQAQTDTQNKVEVSVAATKATGLELKITEGGQEKNFAIPNTAQGEFDFEMLKSKLMEFKGKHPDIFRIELNPSPELAYSEVIKIMDELRQSKNLTPFKFMDPKTKKEVVTTFMFPEVVFGNMMEGS